MDLEHRVIHVFRQPSPAGYQERREPRTGEELHPLAFPQVLLRVADLFAIQ